MLSAPLRFINDRYSNLGFGRVLALLLTPLMLDVLHVVSSHVETIVLCVGTIVDIVSEDCTI